MVADNAQEQEQSQEIAEQGDPFEAIAASLGENGDAPDVGVAEPPPEADQSDEGSEPEPEPDLDDELFSLHLQVNADGDVVDLPENVRMVPREAYDRLKKARDDRASELEKWRPVIDEARQFGEDGQEAIRAVRDRLLQQERAMQHQDPYSMDSTPMDQSQMPNPYAPPPRKNPELEEMRSTLTRLEQMVAQQAIDVKRDEYSRAMTSALQRHGLQGDPLAKDQIKLALARGDTRPVDDILREYLQKRNLTVQGAVSAKAEAAALTPDVGGGVSAPGTPLSPKGLEDLSLQEQSDLMKRAVQRFVTSDEL